jgi:hypothetical protein
MKMDDRSMYPLAMKSLGYPAHRDPATLPSNILNDEFQRFLDRMTELKKTGKPGPWIDRAVCKKCRTSLSGYINSSSAGCAGGNCAFVQSVERWWSLSVWWRPSTWGIGYWESKN